MIAFFGPFLVAQLGFVIRWPEYQASLGVMVISVGIALLGVGLLTGLVCERLPAWFRLPVG